MENLHTGPSGERAVFEIRFSVTNRSDGCIIPPPPAYYNLYCSIPRSHLKLKKKSSVSPRSTPPTLETVCSFYKRTVSSHEPRVIIVRWIHCGAQTRPCTVIMRYSVCVLFVVSRYLFIYYNSIVESVRKSV